MGTVSTTSIRQAADLATCDRLALAIAAERPEQVVLLFAELYERRAQLAKAAGQARQGAMDQWIATLLWTAFGSSRGRDLRVLPEAGSARGGDPMEPWRSADEGVWVHYWQQAQAPKLPPPLRAVLLQGLWELRPLFQPPAGKILPRPIDVLRLAVDVHIEAARWVAEQQVEPATRGMHAAQHWKTAARLAGDVGQPELVAAKLVDLQSAEQVLAKEAPHWSLALVEIELSLALSRGRRRSDLVPDARLEALLRELDNLVLALDQMGHMEHIQPEVLETRSQIERLLGRGPDQKESARRRAQMLERQARTARSGIVASMRWKAAAAEYQQAGLRDEGARAKAEARDALRRAEADGEFQEVFVPINIDRDKHEQMLKPFVDGAADAGVVLRRMGSRLFVPSLEQGRPAKVGPGSIVGQIALTIPTVDDRSLAEIAPGSNEQARFEERRALLQEIALLSGVVISELFDKLRDDFQVHQEDLVAHLAASRFVEPDDLPFLRAAADRYLLGDRISTMHVLVPRIEQMIRRILKAAGTEITALRDGELRERPLGELLRAAEDDGTFPAALTRLLQAVLSEEWGLNLRNRVAHGLVTEGDCSQAHVDRVLHVALHLAGLRLVRQAEKESNAGGPGAETAG